MNKKIRLTIFVLMFLFSILSVSAGFFDSISVETEVHHLNIFSPRLEYFPVNTAFHLHYVAYNSSGKPLLNVGESTCYGELFSPTEDLFQGVLLKESSYKWYFNVSDELFNTTGQIGFGVRCNSSEGEFGAITGGFTVVEDNFKENTGYMSFIMILAVFILIWTLLKISFNLDEEHIIIKLLFTIMSFILAVTGINFGLISITTGNFNIVIVNAATTIYRISMTLTYLFFAYITFYYIWKLFDWINENFIKRK